MIQALEQVKIFHETFKQPVIDKPSIPSSERCQLRFDLIQEELNELKEAYEANDIVGVADALTDLRYVVYGSFLEFGLGDAAEELFDEVQISNMSKLDENGKVLYKPNGKVKKSNLFKEPDLKSIVEKYTIPSKKFKIDVGNIKDEDAEAYFQKIANKFKKITNVENQDNGQVDLRYNVLSAEEDYFISGETGIPKIDVLEDEQSKYVKDQYSKIVNDKYKRPSFLSKFLNKINGK